MSENISKFVVRGHIPSLDGKTDHEAYEFFRPILGDAEETDVDKDGIVHYFYYGDELNQYRPIWSHNEPRQWGLEYVLQEASEYEASATYIDISDLRRIETMMKAKCPAIRNIIIGAYHYYSGTDEPICFEANT